MARSTAAEYREINTIPNRANAARAAREDSRKARFRSKCFDGVEYEIDEETGMLMLRQREVKDRY